MLGHLFQDLLSHPVHAQGWQDVPVTGMTADSRAVEDGSLFAALPGVKYDGALFAADAVAQGAAAVLADEQALINLPHDIPILRAKNPRLTLALAASRFFGDQPQHVVAVTGTNGKTSVAGFVRQIWQRLDVAAASMGTIGVVSDVFSDPESLTTPDPVALHNTLAHLKDRGVDHVALEASSHGLDQYRMHGVQPRVGVFTNISRDHLDYHGTEENYFAAKAQLFSEVVQQDGTAVIDMSAPGGPEMAEVAAERGLRLMTLGRKPEHAVQVMSHTPTEAGSQVEIIWFGSHKSCHIPLVGDFQVSNVLLAAMAVVADGAQPDQVLQALTLVTGVPGRVEPIGATEDGSQVFVDYAHTPDGLEKVLEAVRPHTAAALWVVFGCGGDRDRGKRPMMGAIADRLADRIIITDDNPRSETAETIRAEIREACPRALDIGDRVFAIQTAIKEMAPGDVLVIAGKGHETGQIIGDRIVPHDDRVVAQQALAFQKTESQATGSQVTGSQMIGEVPHG